MAGANICVDRDQFCCSVCLEVLWEPVTIPCGHSYCMTCIKSYWRSGGVKEEYSCPQCRRAFHPRPLLSRNTLLSDLVDKLRRSAVQDAPAECGACAVKKRRAVAFCVKCQTRYCESHLKLHDHQHQLVDVTRRPQNKLCPRHNKLRDFYCRTDRQCVCGSCLADGHEGHSAVTLAEERREKQKLLEETWKKSKHRCKEREKDLREIVKYVKSSVQVVEEDGEKIFSRLLRCVERKQSEVKELIRAEEKTALDQTQILLDKLNQQIVEHRRGEAELEALSATEDHIHFLQTYKTLCGPPDFGSQPTIDVHPYFSLLMLRKAFTELSEKVSNICEREAARISDLVNEQQKATTESSHYSLNTETATDTHITSNNL